MKVKTIQVLKTARYVLSAEPSKEVKNLWIVCHGYGQTATGFLNSFKSIFSKDTLFIAPEGLSKFYWQGFDGKVVSSWMTKENRENEIKDYVNFIEDVVNEISPKLNTKLVCNAFGFSQGTSTILRWANKTKMKLSSIHLYSGQFPDDLLKKWKTKLLPKLQFHIGDKDPFIKKSELEKTKLRLNIHEIRFEFFIVSGRHNIDSNHLKIIFNN
jgi:predicted esterase